MKYLSLILAALLPLTLSAQTKLSDLIEGTTIVATDLIPFVDVSDTTQAASGSTKKATATNVAAGLFALNNLYFSSNTIAQRNGTNAQEFRLYNTYDGTNDEWGFLKWDSNVLKIGTAASGTGTVRSVQLILGNNGATSVSAYGTGVGFWMYNTPMWTLGVASFRDVYTNNNNTVVFGGRSSSAGNLDFGGAHVRIAPGVGTGSADGAKTTLAATLGNQASGTSDHALVDCVVAYIKTANEPMLGMGGVTSSYPALKRSSTTLQSRLADDSAFAPIQGKLTTDTNATTGTITADKYLILYDAAGTAYRVPCVAD